MCYTNLLSPVQFLNTCTYINTIADNFLLDTNNRGLPFARKISPNLNATGPSSAESYFFPHGSKSTSDYRHGGIPKRVESHGNKYMQNGFFFFPNLMLLTCHRYWHIFLAVIHKSCLLPKKPTSLKSVISVIFRP